ncbi:hypothetical protein PAMA_014335 [Pampus argenteus]
MAEGVRPEDYCDEPVEDEFGEIINSGADPLIDMAVKVGPSMDPMALNLLLLSTSDDGCSAVMAGTADGKTRQSSVPKSQPEYNLQATPEISLPALQLQVIPSIGRLTCLLEDIKTKLPMFSTWVLFSITFHHVANYFTVELQGTCTENMNKSHVPLRRTDRERETERERLCSSYTGPSQTVRAPPPGEEEESPSLCKRHREALKHRDITGTVCDRQQAEKHLERSDTHFFTVAPPCPASTPRRTRTNVRRDCAVYLDNQQLGYARFWEFGETSPVFTCSAVVELQSGSAQPGSAQWD